MPGTNIAHLRTCYAMSGIEIACGATGGQGGHEWLRQNLSVCYPTPRNHRQETAISVQFVPGMRFLVFDFALYLRPRVLRDVCSAEPCYMVRPDAPSSPCNPPLSATRLPALTAAIRYLNLRYLLRLDTPPRPYSLC
eukprot:3940817-Rhodomonas_salina.1